MSGGGHEEGVDEVIPMEIIERAEGRRGVKTKGRDEGDPGSNACGFDATESFFEEEREESKDVDGPGSCRDTSVRDTIERDEDPPSSVLRQASNCVDSTMSAVWLGSLVVAPLLLYNRFYPPTGSIHNVIDLMNELTLRASPIASRTDPLLCSSRSTPILSTCTIFPSVVTALILTAIPFLGTS